MHAHAAIAAIPLPKGWPRRIRSAVIHTISLAQTSLTHARSVAANSVNARIRLKEEINRLRQEILLLREESRIKDSRMEQIPAQRRPHYPPVERLAILELRAARRWSLVQTAKRFLVTPVTVASWMTRLDEEGAAALVRVPQPVANERMWASARCSARPSGARFKARGSARGSSTEILLVGGSPTKCLVGTAGVIPALVLAIRGRPRRVVYGQKSDAASGSKQRYSLNVTSESV